MDVFLQPRQLNEILYLFQENRQINYVIRITMSRSWHTERNFAHLSDIQYMLCQTTFSILQASKKARLGWN